jgi:hypothetical protein
LGTKKAVLTAAILAASMIIEHRKDRGSILIMQEFGVKKFDTCQISVKSVCQDVVHHGV